MDYEHLYAAYGLLQRKFCISRIMDGKHVDYTISGPAFDCTFSAVDQVTPPIYSRRLLIFSRQDDNREQSVLALRSGIQRTVNEIPILAGQMGHSPAGWTVKPGEARLRVKDLDMSFSQLQTSGFSEEMLPAHIVSSVPAITDPESEWHACRIQANFIRGGLLLVISINHTTMDGYGISKVIEALSRNCRVHESSAAAHLSVKTDHQLDRSVLLVCKDEAKSGDIRKLDAYTLVQGVPPNLLPSSERIVTKSFQLSLPALKTLKRAASPREGWITTHDAVNALCWRTHARGRYQAGLLSDEDVARFAFPVEFRTLVDPPLPPEYMGNAVLMTKVELPVKTLLGADGLRRAAEAIRHGVRRVDASYVGNFIGVARSLEEPGRLKINLKLERRNTAFGSTSYKSFAHSTLDWDAAALGRYERLRLASGVTGEGMSIILPVLADGSWEVTVSLEEELVALFQTADEWRTYTV